MKTKECPNKARCNFCNSGNCDAPNIGNWDDAQLIAWIQDSSLVRRYPGLKEKVFELIYRYEQAKDIPRGKGGNFV